MRAYNGTYILSMVNHKEVYELTDEIQLQIDKSYENNLRERNPQLGIVEVLPDDNPFKLALGDVVAVNHFTFYGDIGANKSFVVQPHVDWEGKKLFRALPRQIYFKYNGGTPEPIGDTLLCKDVAEIETVNMDPNGGGFYRTKEFSQQGVVTHGDMAGETILVLKSAFYLITLDKVEYFKVKKNEVVAKIVDDVAIPVGKNIIVEYLPDEYQNGHSALLQGTGVHIKNNVTAKVFSVSPDCQMDEMVPMYISGLSAKENHIQVYRNQGVRFKNQWIIQEHTVVFKYELI